MEKFLLSVSYFSFFEYLGNMPENMFRLPLLILKMHKCFEQYQPKFHETRKKEFSGVVNRRKARTAWKKFQFLIFAIVIKLLALPQNDNGNCSLVFIVTRACVLGFDNCMLLNFAGFE